MKNVVAIHIPIGGTEIATMTAVCGTKFGFGVAIVSVNIAVATVIAVLLIGPPKSIAIRPENIIPISTFTHIPSL